MKNTTNETTTTIATKKMSLFVYLLFALGIITTSSAQEQKASETIPTQTVTVDNAEEQQVFAVKGTVKNEEGPAPDIAVAIKGTNIGTYTDFDGHYELMEVPKGAILVLSCVGCKTQEVVVSQETIHTMMEMDFMDTVVLSDPSAAQTYVSKPSLWQKIKRLVQ